MGRAPVMANTAVGHDSDWYRAVVEDNPDFIVRWLPDGTRIFVNMAYCSRLGKPREALVGTSLFAGMSDHERLALRSTISQLTPEQPFSVDERPVERPDGSAGWEEWHVRGIFDERGALTELQSVGRDITPAKRTEEALRTSETRYRRVVEDQTEFISRWQLGGVRTFVNQAYCQYFGRPAAEIVGTSFFSLISEEDRETVQARIARLSPQNPVSSGEHKVLRPDGTMGWNEWTDRAIFDSENRLVEIQSVGRDITKRKKIEEAWRNVAEGVSATTGEQFFRTLVEYLAKALAADCVFLAELTAVNSERARSVAVFSNGEFKDNFEYDLTDTPCHHLFGRALRLFPSGVRSQFPQDSLLAEMGADGFIGTPLLDSQNRALGLVAAIYVKPIADPELAHVVMQIVAARAAAELERKATEQDLRESEERHRTLISLSSEGIGRIEFERPIPVNDPTEEIYRQFMRHGTIAECNDVLARMYGFSSSARMIGIPFRIVAERSEPDVERFREFVRSGCRKGEGEVRVTDVRGNTEHLGVSAIGVVENDFLQRVWLVARDITEGKIAEQELIESHTRLQEVVARTQEFEGIVGGSPEIAKVLRAIETVGPTSSTVLILGETGTGKELVARAVHNRSSRKAKPFVAVNCATLSPGLIESELFGHEKGAFTGAASLKRGRFELAHRATIFLDEIGDLSLDMQVKLLRMLQEGEFERVGGTQTLKVDVRVIAATNRDLEAAVEAGHFRSDLYYRLNVFPLRLPPLRERKSDIPPLVHHFIADLSKKLGKSLTGVSHASMIRLMGHDWPGNVRELEHVIERAAILAPAPVFEIAELRRLDRSRPAPPQTLADVERAHILATLKQTGWVIEGPYGAAKLLGIHPNTLRHRLQKLNIKRPLTVTQSQ